MSFSITKIWAFLSVDENDEEGVCAFYDSFQMRWMPLIGADQKRIEHLKVIAQNIATQNNQKVKLVEFETRKEIEEIKPSHS